MTQLTEILQKRRSVYALNRNLPVSEEAVIDLVKKVTELVPDAFNMKSQRVIIALGDKQDALWDGIYDAFGGVESEREPKEKEDISVRVTIAR